MKIVLHHRASKYYSRLCEPFKSQVKDAIDGLEKEPPEGNIRSYEGNSGILR
ncbi:MAG: hypothetical protein LBC77_06380 [Spirochaetaceae bacterium]|jgi:mRNA-degrading endonuclease RelE of RelBE toxin-antitoxin system|nr:hypothetical protein [Spirochaetaceae bacterium]